MGRSFNGTSDKIDVDAAHVTVASNPFSISVWVNSSLANANAKCPYAEGSTAGAGPFFLLQGDGSGKLVISLRRSTAGSSDAFTSNAVVFDGTWHHICITQDASNNLILYVDGVQDNTLTRTALSNPAGTFNTASFGYAHRNTSSAFYGGALAHGAIWNLQLTAAIVKALAGGWHPLEFAPLHYWEFAGQASPEPDTGSSPVNATLTGTSPATSPTLAPPQAVVMA